MVERERRERNEVPGPGGERMEIFKALFLDRILPYGVWNGSCSVSPWLVMKSNSHGMCYNTRFVWRKMLEAWLPWMVEVMETLQSQAEHSQIMSPPLFALQGSWHWSLACCHSPPNISQSFIPPSLSSTTALQNPLGLASSGCPCAAQGESNLSSSSPQLVLTQHRVPSSSLVFSFC